MAPMQHEVSLNNMVVPASLLFFFSSRRRHTRYWRDWSSDVCSSDLTALRVTEAEALVTGRPLTDDLIEQAAQRAIETSRPISDQRASAEYRREMVGADRESVG